jgi:hypothetical protein
VVRKDVAAQPQNPLTAYAFFFKETHVSSNHLAKKESSILFADSADSLKAMMPWLEYQQFPLSAAHDSPILLRR